MKKTVTALAFFFVSCAVLSPGEEVMKTSDLKARLDPLQYHVSQECGTEPPFNNAYWDNKKAGIYVDVVSGEVLFTSKEKFDSGTGWPSFTAPVSEDAIKTQVDLSHGMKRVEVRSREGDSHLGHLFKDGPGGGGLRYCINSASLKFIAVEELEEEGYGEYTKLFNFATYEKATFGGGCFWGMEKLLQEVPGVIATNVGYAGGTTVSPGYKSVSTGLTGHAEVVQLTYDPKQISYEELLDYFWRIHDPTTLNRQHNDMGTQYRSIILYHTEEQRTIAEKSKALFDKKNSLGKASVTEIKKLDAFYEAEEYHQDYLIKNPNGYMCHILRDEW